jgi:hypothetical protein
MIQHVHVWKRHRMEHFVDHTAVEQIKLPNVFQVILLFK